MQASLTYGSMLRPTPEEAMPRILRRVRRVCAYSSSILKYSAHRSALPGHMRRPRCMRARAAPALRLCSNSQALAWIHRLASRGCSCRAFVTTCQEQWE